MRALAALALLLATPSAAQDGRAAADAGVRDRVERALKESGFAGVYAVSAGGRRVAGGAIGEAEPGAPFRVETIFPWASVTKQVVAAMVMQDVAAGRIALDAPAARYLTALGGGARSPTVRELLQHRSGLRNPDDTPEGADGWPGWYTGPATGLSWCLGGRGTPGGNWRYNNCDYLALGAIVERVNGGRPLPELFVARVAGPAGIDARFVAGPDEPRADANWPGGPTGAERDILARFGAAGGLVGTAEDLLAFDAALVSGAVVPGRVRGEMWRGDPKLGFQALGQWVFPAALKGCAEPVRLVERRGGVGRFQVRNIIAPDRNFAMVLLTNRPEERFAFGEIWQGKGPSHDLLAAALCP